MKSVYLRSLSLSAVLLACSGSGDSDNTPNDLADAAGQGGDGGGARCETKPARLVVLGDSIAACTGVGEKDASTCGPKIFHDALASSYAPGVTYENLSVPGASTTDVVDKQLSTVPTGSGHPMVVLYVGGNDLRQYMTMSDGDATAAFATNLPGIVEDWQSIFAFFADRDKFPDGVTIVMNNQYSPFDDCTAPPYNMSATKNCLIVEFNDKLAELADGNAQAVLTDQYTPYLGHGHHYDVATCPHYQAGLAPFMGDLIHPNAAGHANLAAQWRLVADSLYGACP